MTIFEKIISREISSYIVYEDELVIAFLDIMQSTKGHTLVVPKKPYKDIFEIDEKTLAHLITVVQKITKAINSKFNPLGINLLNNNKESAGQTVFHFHFHIIPRYKDDQIRFNFVNNMDKLTALDYEKRASLIKEALL